MKNTALLLFFVNERGEYFELEDIGDFDFSIDNIDEYYVKEILQEEPILEKKQLRF